VPEPTRITLVTSLVQRFNQSQKDFEVKVEFVPQAQARQKLISAISAGSPPDVCQVWDNWLGQFQAMGAVEDLTSRAKAWKHQQDVQDTAWQTVTVGNQIVSLPLALTLGTFSIGLIASRARPQAPTPTDLTASWRSQRLHQGGENRYGYGMRGAGAPGRCLSERICVRQWRGGLKDGKLAINSKGRSRRCLVYRPALKHKVAAQRCSRWLRRVVETFDVRHQHVPAQFGLGRPAEGIRAALLRCHCPSGRQRSARPFISPRRSPRSKPAATRKARGNS
jgi:hypothetical protein